MTNVLILGANGQLARNTTRVFLRDTDAKLTLYLRRARRLTNPDPHRVTIVEGDVLDRPTLEAAMKGQDVVYASLAGAMKQQAESIVEAMHAAGLKRLIFVSSMGIYDEVPGEQGPRGVAEQRVRSDREAGPDRGNGDPPQPGREPGVTFVVAMSSFE
jgi:uncharacterized protein YbjT (DUF2867 family)